MTGARRFQWRGKERRLAQLRHACIGGAGEVCLAFYGKALGTDFPAALEMRLALP